MNAHIVKKATRLRLSRKQLQIFYISFGIKTQQLERINERKHCKSPEIREIRSELSREAGKVIIKQI